MNIVIVGGGTAGWITALLAARRHPNHHITVVESSHIGVVGVGESTTGFITDLLLNNFYDLGCNINEFIAETGATLKFGIKHKGWTNDIDQHYIGPIDGSWTSASSPDAMFCWGVKSLEPKDLLTTARCGYWTEHGHSNFNINSQSFEIPAHAMHVDAYLVGKYFKKLTLKNPNTTYIDGEVIKVHLNAVSGNIQILDLKDGSSVNGDFFIDCSGFHKVLIKELPTKWISYQDNLPLNTAMPFLLDYEENEMPEPYTTAWAQKNGWMWQIPMMDRKGNGYVFCDKFTTPDKAVEEIETILGKKINPTKVIKFDAGRQEKAWVKNCVAIGLSSAFLEPLEATSIHSSIVQARIFIFEYLKPTLEDTLNPGSMNIHNQRVGKLYDDVKDFLVMHYMGNRNDSEFWKYIQTGETQTEFVKNLLSMAKSKIPSTHDFPGYFGSAGWPLYSYVMAGLGLLDKNVAANELNLELPAYGPLSPVTAQTYYDLQDQWRDEAKLCYSYNEFIRYFRDLRYKNGYSNKKY
jgi:tryptophan halogenase